MGLHKNARSNLVNFGGIGTVPSPGSGTSQ